MYHTLDELEYALTHREKKGFKFSTFFHELKVLGSIFCILFLGTYLVTNAQLVIDNFSDYFSPEKVLELNQSNSESHYSANKKSLRGKEAQVESLVEEYEGIISMEQRIAPDLDQVLQHNLSDYEFSFNLLPPTNRLIIPSINLDVPLIETQLKNYDNINESSFDSDLENGVVRYPTTPTPGEGGNTFFFGHTSQEYWKSNPYGTVFRNIPQLKANDKIQVVRNGVLYEYKVLKTVIVKPKQVNDTYVKFGEEGKEYITLMGCYPIGRTDKRMMIFAERIS